MIDRIIEKYKKKFGEFYREFLIFAKNKLQEKLSEKEDFLTLITIDRLMESFLEEIMSEISKIAIRMLVVEIRLMSNNGELKGNDKFARYNDYIITLKNREYLLELRKKYPLVWSLIYERIEYKIELWYSCIDNLIKDRIAIKNQFGINIEDINNIKPTSGDTHCKGKHVMILEFRDKKLVYKPHNMSTDILFNKLIQLLNKKSNLDLSYLEVINRDNYGWQEYIVHENNFDGVDIHNYFKKAGALLAVSNALLFSDLHNENIVFTRKQPYIIDFETITRNSTSLYRKADVDEKYMHSIKYDIFEDIGQSVLDTMLLPMNATFSLMDVDVGGFSFNEGQCSRKYFSCVLRNEGTDDIKFVKIPSECSVKENRLYVDGKNISIRKYKDDFVTGYRYLYDIIQKNRTEILDIIKSNGAIIRQVLRPTALYTRIIEAATYPDYCKSNADREKILRKICCKDTGDKIRKIVSQEEIIEMSRGDIPYAYTKSNSKSLWINEKRVDNYFEKSIIEIIEEHLENMNEKDREKQIYYINLALSTLKVEKNESEKRYLFKDKYINFECELAIKIGEFIKEKVVWNKSGDECLWLIVTDNKDKMIMDFSDMHLYNFGGTILFFAYLWRITKNRSYMDLVESYIRVFDFEMKNYNLSAFCGMGSYLYIYYNLFEITKDDIYKDKILRILKCFSEDKVKLEQTDVISGVAGTIIIICNILNKWDEPMLKKVLKRLSKKIYNNVKLDIYEKYTGFAHGFAGIAYALVFSGIMLDIEEYIEMAYILVTKENSYCNRKLCGWKDLRFTEFIKFDYWCHGSAGIIISRIKMHEKLSKHKDKYSNFLEILEKDIELIGEAMNNIYYYDNKDNLSLCHGLLGQIDALIELNKYNSTNGDILKKVSEKVKKIIIDSGFVTGNNKSIEDYTFMNGLSGIGYELLRIYDTKCPSILSLEV